MTNIGVILSDNSHKRNCLGLALDMEERINRFPGFMAQMADLQDYKNDVEGLQSLAAYDAFVFVVQENDETLPSCIRQMISTNYSTLKYKPSLTMVNACTNQIGNAVNDLLRTTLGEQNLIVFHKNVIFNEIQEQFNSSYQVINESLNKELNELVDGFLPFVNNWVPQTQELGETV